MPREKSCRICTESQINYMWDEYEITLSDAAGMRNEELNDLPAMKRDISSFKGSDQKAW